VSLASPSAPRRSEGDRPARASPVRPAARIPARLRAAIEGAVAPGHDPLPRQRRARHRPEQVRLVAPSGVREEPVTSLATHVPGECQPRSGADAEPGGGSRGARLCNVEPEAEAHGQVSRTKRVLEVRGHGPCPGPAVQVVDLHPVGAVLRLAGAALRAAVEEARPTGKGDRAMPGIEPPLQPPVESLEAQHPMDAPRQPEAAPCLLERARAEGRGERAGRAVGDPARQVQPARPIGRLQGICRGVPVLHREPEVETGSGRERVRPADSGEEGELAVEACRRLGAAEAVGGLGPASCEDQEREPVRAVRQPAGDHREGLTGTPAAREPGLGRGKADTRCIEREHRAETAHRERATEHARGTPGAARRRDRALGRRRRRSVRPARRAEGRPRAPGAPSVRPRPPRGDQPVVEDERLGPSEPAQADIRGRGAPCAAGDGQHGWEERAGSRGEGKSVHRELALEGQRLKECPGESAWARPETRLRFVVVEAEDPEARVPVRVGTAGCAAGAAPLSISGTRLRPRCDTGGFRPSGEWRARIGRACSHPR
jgi:hypothetical protein